MYKDHLLTVESLYVWVDIRLENFVISLDDSKDSFAIVNKHFQRVFFHLYLFAYSNIVVYVNLLSFFFRNSFFW